MFPNKQTNYFGLKPQLFFWKHKGKQTPCELQLREVNLGICSKAEKIFQQVVGEGWTACRVHSVRLGCETAAAG